MSARRGRAARESLDVFDNSSRLSLAETDAAIFGDLSKVDVGRVNVRPVSIQDIHPDPSQPRRAVPSPVRVFWDGRPSGIRTLFARWYEMAIQESGREFKLEPFLEAGEEVPRPEKMGPIEASLIEIVELAANIRANGLTYPITVVHTPPQGYQLETGERRWLAYNLLSIFFPDEGVTWERIPARVVEDFSVWRQASENSARANLNAISRARQLAILLMDLYRAQGERFYAYDEIVTNGGSDRPYYAQVGDGEHGYPIPRGQGELVLNSAGFKNASQLREHRSLLRLPDEVWKIADDLNWTQGRIRLLQRAARKKAKFLGQDESKMMVSLALEQASEQGYRIGISQPHSPTPVLDEPEETGNPLFSPKISERFRRMKGLAKRVGEGGGKLTDADLLWITDARKVFNEWLDELERGVRDQMRK